MTSRQQARHELREAIWQQWQVVRDRHGNVVNGPRDEGGIMARHVRRGIAAALFKRQWMLRGVAA